MKKSIQRLLMFTISVPIIVAIILFLPHFDHLVLNIFIVIFTALGAVEFSKILSQKINAIPVALAAILGALPPAAMTMVISFGVNPLLVPAVFAAAVLWLLMSGILSRDEALASFVNRLAAGFAVLVYPSFLMSWLIILSRLAKNHDQEGSAGIIILAFVCTVFASDSTAWAVGNLFGRGNQGVIPVSPKKSVAGFIGAAFGSIVIGIGAVAIRPDIFTPLGKLSSVPFLSGALLCLLTGAAAALGDLAASAIKRSSGVKDSGNLIPGRGGVLDSIDSIAFAAPVFYITFRLLFAGY